MVVVETFYLKGGAADLSLQVWLLVLLAGRPLG